MTTEEWVEQQYADRPHLRRIYEIVIDAAKTCGEDVVIQARKSYVSIVSPRRTFARVQSTTRWRVDVALRLDGVRPHGRVLPSRSFATMPVQIGLMTPSDFDAEARELLRRAYQENC